MTLRARLTTAFLAMVLGPVLLGAIFVGTTVTTLNRERAAGRLDVAANAVRTSVTALCGQLRAVAEAVAMAPPDQRMPMSREFVARGLVTGVHIDRGVDGETTDEAPPPPWADCAGPDAKVHSDGVSGFEALTVRVPLSEPVGGSVSAALVVNADLVKRLAGASGAELTLLAGAGVVNVPTVAPSIVEPSALGDSELESEEGPAPTEAEMVQPELPALALPTTVPTAPIHSSLTGDQAGPIAAIAAGLGDGGTGMASNGHLVHRIGPVAGEPLPIAVSLPATAPHTTYVWLVAVVLIVALAATVMAFWLARTTTSPLAGLAAAADRVAGGDLEVRVAMSGPATDEIGRLTAAFNHMTRELHTYVTALTVSRDQLRGHLGVLGDTLSSTHDLDRILRVILETVKHATGASAGIVLLADPVTGDLIGKCGEGIGRDLSTIRVPVGQGLVGSVAATGVARIGRVERDGPRLDSGEPECHSYVAVPFSTPGESPAGLAAARGVLALYDHDFQENDLITLRTFAGQAAVAVDNVRVHEEAQRLSVTDPLTGLFNFRSLREVLRRETERAGIFGRKLSVLVMDLDRFKEINDGYGHAAGDAVLAEFATRIRHEIREVDVAFRHGGEEFAILLPETDEVGGITVAERLCEAVRRVPITVPARADGPDITVSVTVSIGLAVFPDHGIGDSSVLRAADDALYAAKAAGRDTFRVASTALSSIGAGQIGLDGASSGPQAPRQVRGR